MDGPIGIKLISEVESSSLWTVLLFLTLGYLLTLLIIILLKFYSRGWGVPIILSINDLLVGDPVFLLLHLHFRLILYS